MVLPEEVAAHILAETVFRRASLRSIAEEYFSENPGLDYMKPLVRVLTLGVARNYLLLDRAMELLGYGPPSHSRRWMLVRVLAFEAMMGKLKPSRARALAEKTGVRLEDVEKLKAMKPRDVVRGLGGVERLSVLYSFPRWMIEELLEARIPGLEQLLASLNRDPTRWLRIAPGVDKGALAESLRSQGVVVEWDRDLPDVGRIVEGASAATRTREYSMGLYVIQDKASALVGHVLAPTGRLAVDPTAGAGVKITHALWLGARYAVAGDVKPQRLRESRLLATRLRLRHSLDHVVADGRRPPLRGFGAAVVDPPCTDIGRLQYEPEIKLWLTRGDLKFFRRLQERLLTALLEAAPRGAVVVYSVCTLTRSETFWVVRRALEKVGEAELVKAEPMIGDPVPQTPGAQRLYPHRHSTQGFYIAKIVKL